MKKIIILAAFITCISTTVSAQVKQDYTIDYSTGILIGSSNDFIPRFSWAGFALSGQIFPIEHLAIGFQFGLNNYYNLTENSTYDLGHGAKVTAKQYNYIKQIPFLVGVFYHPLPDKIVQPYLGVKLGFNYATESIFIQDYEFYDDQFAFQVSPEVGAFFKFGKAPVGAKLSVSYNFATNQYEFLQSYKNLQSFTINLGIAYMLH